MGIEELVARLERDTDARVAEIDARSQREIDAIEAQGALAASRKQLVALSVQRAERRVRLDGELAEARRRARDAALRARYASVDRVMARAEELLAGASTDSAYAAVFAARLHVALGFFSGGAVVRCCPALAAAARAALQGEEGVVVEESGGMAAGFTVSAHDGSMDIDETLIARLNGMRQELVIELTKEIADVR